MAPYIKSVLCEDAYADFEKSIDVLTLISQYKTIFGIDISSMISSNCTHISRYRCKSSGFRFYEPANIVGDSQFYAELQKNDWYYRKEKWEFFETINHIQNLPIKPKKLLDIGSAQGYFLRLVQHEINGVECVGLELNEEATNDAILSGYDVRIESLEKHLLVSRDYYDIVTSFQVLEHVPQPRKFLADSIQLLKKGGRLIIGVPDNSYRPYKSIFVDENNILNMPPHHQGLWDIPSLSYLAKIFPLRLDSIVVEPSIHLYQRNAYRGLLKQDIIKKYGNVFGQGLYAFARPFYNHSLRLLAPYLPSHTVLAFFTKL